MTSSKFGNTNTMKVKKAVQEISDSPGVKLVWFNVFCCCNSCTSSQCMI